jgi:hypothetical protein
MSKKEVETKKRGGWASQWRPEEDKILMDAVGEVKFAMNRLIQPVLDAGKLPGRSLESCLWRVSAIRKKADKASAPDGSASAQPPHIEPKSAAAVEAKAEKNTTKSFAQVWEESDADESTLNSRVERFYDAAVAAGWPAAVVEAYVACLQELSSSMGMLADDLESERVYSSTVNDHLVALGHDLGRHEHGEKSGKALFPLEES